MESTWRKNYLRYKSFFLNMLSQYRERADWKAYLEILLSLGTISVFALFALKPTVITIAQLIKEIDEKKQTLSRMEEKIQNLSKAQIIYDQQRGNVTLLEETSVPDTVKPDLFARQVEGLSTKHQVDLASFALGKSTLISPEGIQTVKQEQTNKSEGEFGVTTSANIDNFELLTAFLSDFRNMRQPPSLEKIEFKVEFERAQNIKNIMLSISGRLPFLPK